MTALGDSIKEEKASSLSAVGVRKILKSGSNKAVKGYSMAALALEALDVPGRVSTHENPEKSAVTSLKAALQQKEQKLITLRQQAEEQEKQAFEKGLDQGRDEGRQQGETEAREKYQQALKGLQKQLQEILQGFANQKKGLFQDFEKRIPQIVMKSVRKIFSGIADRHADAIVPVIRKAVRSIGAAEAILVKVNPGNLKAAEDNQNLWRPFENGPQDIKLESDSRIPATSCLIESNSTSAEITIQKILSDMEAELARVFNEEGEPAVDFDCSGEYNRTEPSNDDKEGE
jgi:flagellar biosynthesis/type III secretory pathway protein FliH